MPDEIAELARNGRTAQKLAKSIDELPERRKQIVEMLLQVAKEEPTLNEACDEATWAVEMKPGKVHLKRVGQRWYMCNH